MKKKNLITASPSRRNPYFNMVEFKRRDLVYLNQEKNITCRQKAPKVFDMNASIYISGKKNICLNALKQFLKILLYI